MPKLDPIIKLPGLVDVHVHLREPGNTHKEDFQTGTAAAVAGGYTQILDMPNNTPPTTTPQALDEKIKLAYGKIWCDLGFNFGATPQSVKYFNQISKKSFGLKVYMNQTTGPLLIKNNSDRQLIFKSWNSLVPIMVHAEGETVETAIKLAKKYKKPLHICHVTADQIPEIERAKKEGNPITCEVCPHHLFLDMTDLKYLGPFGMMKPSLESAKNRQKLWDNLDKIDMISTDHAPHTKEEKLDKTTPYFGVPGLEATLPLMLQAAARGLLSIDRLIDMLANTPRRVFHLPTQVDTSVLVDTSQEYNISDLKLYTKCAWTPFAAKKGRGKIKQVTIRGEIIIENGKFIDSPKGQVISPT